MGGGWVKLDATAHASGPCGERLTNAAAAEVAGECDARTEKPVLRISRRRHDTIKSSVVTQNFVHRTDYKAVANTADTSAAYCAIAPARSAERANARRKKTSAISAPR